MLFRQITWNPIAPQLVVVASSGTIANGEVMFTLPHGTGTVGQGSPPCPSAAAAASTNGADETRRSRKKDGAMGGRDETNEGGESAVMG